MKERTVSMSNTENENDGLETNTRLEKSVGLRCPIWGEKIDPMAVSLVGRNCTSGTFFWV